MAGSMISKLTFSLLYRAARKIKFATGRMDYNDFGDSSETHSSSTRKNDRGLLTVISQGSNRAELN